MIDLAGDDDEDEAAPTVEAAGVAEKDSAADQRHGGPEGSTGGTRTR